MAVIGGKSVSSSASASASAVALRASAATDEDSDFSDFEADEEDLENETVNNNWLDEVDEEVIEEEVSSPNPKSSSFDMLVGKTAHQRAYVTNNRFGFHDSLSLSFSLCLS
jgi:hypothetical protein